ncbi:putative metalloprotease with PDZ domain [Hephaestia caeni]|uniref:Putative metalloprotease with PDZ domain n=1 Tax=Hephaestia caeni TaxID=645617 RepID=A0A397NMU5_9SPHN|nr:PDZ domain-containing protein [Hephaestia caeni]RIA37708.1 putative metalloprotease with PDZ domain [Hephaestia caeni]
MKRHILAGTVLALMAGTAQAQAPARDPGPNAPIRYDVRFDNAAHHEARISVTYRDLKPGPVTFRMARSSPGRYAVHEFAKNVYSVTATDSAGKAVPITRRDPYSWTVADHDGTVTIRYTLYGDRGDGTYAQIDLTHAHLNMPATFMWAVGYDDRPIRVTFHPLHPDWKIATQMPAATGAANTFWAPNFQYFMDSPTELSDFALRTWQVPGPGGKDYTFRLAIHSQDDDADIDRFVGMAKAVVAEHNKVFGGPPPLDFGTYTFIADYMPQISGDGMEHRNSTMISQPRSLKAADFGQIDTLSHEYIHAWNVERLRPAGLEPFDYTQADSTRSLWFAEGFTQYYGPLLIHRAGESSLDDYLKTLGATLNYVVNAPGRAYGSPQEMSLRAPFVDAATAIDPVNGNIFTSYYPYGAIIGLALDLTLRERYKLSLDDYMRHMWQRNGAAQVDYAPAKPYTPEDLQAGLAELTGDPAFAKTFFDASIRGSALPDFAPLLAQAGLVLRAANPQHGWLGASRATMAGDTLTLDQIPLPDSPLYKAGIDKGDMLVSLDGAALASADAWNKALAALKPGQEARLVYRNRTGERTATLKAVADPTLEVVATEAVGGTLTAAQKTFREAWLGKQ